MVALLIYGTMTSKQIIKKTGACWGYTRLVFHELENNNYIISYRCRNDARTNHYALTQEGKDYLFGRGLTI